MTSENIHNILLITLSNIGDAVMTTPVMEALHEKYPQAVMDIVADARSSELFEHCPYRGEVLLKDKQAGWPGLLALVRQLRRKRYDLVVDLRTDGLSLLLRAGRRLTRRGSRATGSHAVQRHFGVIGAREHIHTLPACRLWLSEQEQTFARQQLASLPGERWLAVAPGARWHAKCWPVESFHALVNRVQDLFDGIVLLGSEADRQRCQQVADNSALTCLNLAGKTSLLEAAAVLQQTALCIGNDSGAGHIAAACDTATLTLFGPGDPERYHPWHPQARWLQSGTGEVAGISVDEVVAEVKTIRACKALLRH